MAIAGKVLGNVTKKAKSFGHTLKENMKPGDNSIFRKFKEEKAVTPNNVPYIAPYTETEDAIRVGNDDNEMLAIMRKSQLKGVDTSSKSVSETNKKTDEAVSKTSEESNEEDPLSILHQAQDVKKSTNNIGDEENPLSILHQAQDGARFDGYHYDKNGKLRRPNGEFASKQEQQQYDSINGFKNAKEWLKEKREKSNSESSKSQGDSDGVSSGNTSTTNTTSTQQSSFDNDGTSSSKTTSSSSKDEDKKETPKNSVIPTKDEKLMGTKDENDNIYIPDDISGSGISASAKQHAYRSAYEKAQGADKWLAEQRKKLEASRPDGMTDEEWAKTYNPADKKLYEEAQRRKEAFDKIRTNPTEIHAGLKDYLAGNPHTLLTAGGGATMGYVALQLSDSRGQLTNQQLYGQDDLT